MMVSLFFYFFEKEVAFFLRMEGILLLLNLDTHSIQLLSDWSFMNMFQCLNLCCAAIEIIIPGMQQRLVFGSCRDQGNSWYRAEVGGLLRNLSTFDHCPLHRIVFNDNAPAAGRGVGIDIYLCWCLHPGQSAP